jgi:hypothetical protein
MKQPWGGAFPAAPNGDLQVFLSAVAVQLQPNGGEHLMLVGSRRIKVQEHASVGRDAEPALT